MMMKPTPDQLDTAFEAYIEAAKTWQVQPRAGAWVLTDYYKPMPVKADCNPIPQFEESFVIIPFSTEAAAKAARLRMILRDTLTAVCSPCDPEEVTHAKELAIIDTTTVKKGT